MQFVFIPIVFLCMTGFFIRFDEFYNLLFALGTLLEMKTIQKKSEVQYNNPASLNFYLTKQWQAKLNVDIIKKASLPTDLGTLEFAIIGGSHFVSLKDYFMEILSCTIENIAEDKLIFKQNGTSLKYEYNFENLNYQTVIEDLLFNRPDRFKSVEKEILNRKPQLFHCFDEQTAITAIKIDLPENGTVKITTWHTYPEFLTIVLSETKLKISDM